MDIEDDFFKGTKLLQLVQEGQEKFSHAIFISRLNNHNKKIRTSREDALKLLARAKDIISNKWPYLIDEYGDFMINKVNLGFNIPIGPSDDEELLHYLKKANEVLLKEEGIKFFIEKSHIRPDNGHKLIKTQFKDLPPNFNTLKIKDSFSIFGNIKEVSKKDGVWTVLFDKLKWYLPLKYYQHQQSKSKNRWFEIQGFKCSFASNAPCSLCSIKGHDAYGCPGDPLIEKLKEEYNKPKDEVFPHIIPFDQNPIPIDNIISPGKNKDNNLENKFIFQVDSPKKDSPTKSPLKKKTKKKK